MTSIFIFILGSWLCCQDNELWYGVHNVFYDHNRLSDDIPLLNEEQILLLWITHFIISCAITHVVTSEVY
jgi:hypothetical protein